VAIKVEKKNDLWNVDFGGGIQQDFRDWQQAVNAAHAAAALNRRGYVIIDRGDSLRRTVSRPA
jgi:hypothetical protein